MVSFNPDYRASETYRCLRITSPLEVQGMRGPGIYKHKKLHIYFVVLLQKIRTSGLNEWWWSQLRGPKIESLF